MTLLLLCQLAVTAAKMFVLESCIDCMVFRVFLIWGFGLILNFFSDFSGFFL